MSSKDDSANRMECHPGYVLDKEILTLAVIRHIRCIQREDKPQASGSNFLTVVVLSSAKKAPRCMHLKWLM